MIEWKSLHDGKGPKPSICHFLVEEYNIALPALLWSLLLENQVPLEMVTSFTLGKEIHALLLQNFKLYQYNHVVIELIEQKWDFCGRKLTCIYREVIFILFIGDLFVIIQIMNVLLLCPKLQKSNFMHFFPNFLSINWKPSFCSFIYKHDFGKNQKVGQNLYLLKIAILNMYSGIIKTRLVGIPLVSIAIILYFNQWRVARSGLWSPEISVNLQERLE